MNSLCPCRLFFLPANAYVPFVNCSSFGKICTSHNQSFFVIPFVFHSLTHQRIDQYAFLFQCWWEEVHACFLFLSPLSCFVFSSLLFSDSDCKSVKLSFCCCPNFPVASKTPLCHFECTCLFLPSILTSTSSPPFLPLSFSLLCSPHPVSP